jgi:hypothetical protein
MSDNRISIKAYIENLVIITNTDEETIKKMFFEKMEEITVPEEMKDTLEDKQLREYKLVNATRGILYEYFLAVLVSNFKIPLQRAEEILSTIQEDKVKEVFDIADILLDLETLEKSYDNILIDRALGHFYNFYSNNLQLLVAQAEQYVNVEDIKDIISEIVDKISEDERDDR